jgi:hypothetical protein
MDQVSLSQFHLQQKVLGFFGLWQPKSSSRFLQIRCHISHFLFNLVTLVLPIINYSFFEADFDNVCVHIASFVGTSLKIPFLIFQMEKFVQLYEDLKVIIDLTKSDKVSERVHVKRQIKIMERVLKFFYLALAIINTSDIIGSLYGGYIPYKHWFPYKLQVVVDHLDLFSIAQVLLITLVELITVSIEVLPTYFIGMSSVLLLELSERIESFSGESDDEENYLELKTCVQLHQRISDFVFRIEKQFSAMLFIQGFVFSAYLCFYVLYLSKVRYHSYESDKILVFSTDYQGFILDQGISCTATSSPPHFPTKLHRTASNVRVREVESEFIQLRASQAEQKIQKFVDDHHGTSEAAL